MVFEVYAIKDTVVGTFGAPFIVPNKETAIRTFKIQNSDKPIYKDLQLYKLGDFNIYTGHLNETDFQFILGGEENAQV